MQGRKWRNVIVTIPTIDVPPVPPPRKKRTAPLRSDFGDSHATHASEKILNQANTDSKGAVVEATNYLKTFDKITSSQLRGYLRITKTGLFVCRMNWRTSHWICSSDLCFSHSRPKDSESIKMSVSSSSSFQQTLQLRYSRNSGSLTNEPNDRFLFRDVNACGFKNFLLFTAKWNFDKLRFWKMCQPPLKLSSKSRLQRAHLLLPDSILVVVEDDDAASCAGAEKQRERQCQKHAATAKTNQNHDGVLCSPGSNIGKVWKTMKKNSLKSAIIGEDNVRVATSGKQKLKKLNLQQGTVSDFFTNMILEEDQITAAGLTLVSDNVDANVCCSKLETSLITNNICGDAVDKYSFRADQ